MSGGTCDRGPVSEDLSSRGHPLGAEHLPRDFARRLAAAPSPATWIAGDRTSPRASRGPLLPVSAEAAVFVAEGWPPMGKAQFAAGVLLHSAVPL